MEGKLERYHTILDIVLRPALSMYQLPEFQNSHISGGWKGSGWF